MNDRPIDQSSILVTWADLHRDTRALVSRLLAGDAGPGPWRGIVAITRGGMVPAAVIARETNIRRIETLAVASYNGTRQGKLEVLATPAQAITDKGAGWLVVDDIVDTGRTAAAARELLPDAALVSLYAKPRALDLVDLYLQLVAQDCWIHFPWDTEDRAGRRSYVAPLTASE